MQKEEEKNVNPTRVTWWWWWNAMLQMNFSFRIEFWKSCFWFRIRVFKKVPVIEKGKQLLSTSSCVLGWLIHRTKASQWKTLLCHLCSAGAHAMFSISLCGTSRTHPKCGPTPCARKACQKNWLLGPCKPDPDQSSFSELGKISWIPCFLVLKPGCYARGLDFKSRESVCGLQSIFKEGFVMGWQSIADIKHYFAHLFQGSINYSEFCQLACCLYLIVANANWPRWGFATTMLVQQEYHNCHGWKWFPASESRGSWGFRLLLFGFAWTL